MQMLGAALEPAENARVTKLRQAHDAGRDQWEQSNALGQGLDKATQCHIGEVALYTPAMKHRQDGRRREPAAASHDAQRGALGTIRFGLQQWTHSHARGTNSSPFSHTKLSGSQLDRPGRGHVLRTAEAPSLKARPRC